MLKNDNSSNSWSTFYYQGSFREITGRSAGYTQKLNMVDDGKEDGSWSSSLGSEIGHDFNIGK